MWFYLDFLQIRVYYSVFVDCLNGEDRAVTYFFVLLTGSERQGGIHHLNISSLLKSQKNVNSIKMRFLKPFNNRIHLFN